MSLSTASIMHNSAAYPSCGRLDRGFCG